MPRRDEATLGAHRRSCKLEPVDRPSGANVVADEGEAVDGTTEVVSRAARSW
jgi:hypothetical protein